MLNGYRKEVSFVKKWAFLIGCIEPDFNPVTYLHKNPLFEQWKGHNAELRKKHIEDRLTWLEDMSKQGVYRWFILGRLMHYLADSFTFVHNEAFEGTMEEHVLYEKDMHQFFPISLMMQRKITENKAKTPPNAFEKKENAVKYFREKRTEYMKQRHDAKLDCVSIVSVCKDVFDAMMVSKVDRHKSATV